MNRRAVEREAEANTLDASVGGVAPAVEAAGGKSLVDRLKQIVGWKPRGSALKPFEGDEVQITKKDVARAVRGWNENEDVAEYEGILQAREPEADEIAIAELEAELPAWEED